MGKGVAPFKDPENQDQTQETRHIQKKVISRITRPPLMSVREAQVLIGTKSNSCLS